MPPDTSHPATRFKTPGNIQTGVPLKELLNAKLVRLIGESFAAVVPAFSRQRFERQANAGLDELELTPRAKHIGRAIGAQLPLKFIDACPLLVAALGPELEQTEGNGLGPFFYLPHAHLIHDQGIEDFESGMAANYEITKRFSAEFSIRPFLVKYRDATLKRLTTWAKDSNTHVRRLVSEGTRPRLPWAMRLKEFQADPSYTLPLLELLKDDPELYVRRSVANHLGDLLKDHPQMVLGTCERWLKEVSKRSCAVEVASARKWVIRHAVRHPAKNGDAKAISLRLAAK